MLGGPGREFYGTACTKLAAVSKAQNLAIPGCLNAGDFASLITTLIQRFPILI
jgi:hypothetical protein